MKRYSSLFRFDLPKTIAYMLQSAEYDVRAYVKWLWRIDDFSRVSNRRQLDKTTIAKLILAFLVIGIALQYCVGLLLMVLGVLSIHWFMIGVGLAVFLFAPIVWAHLVVVPVELARRLLIEPKQRQQDQETKAILSQHKAIKIAVAGSYGKTTMKEILAAVLSEGLKVAATPANKNVATAHYQFAKSLQGDEDVIIIEYGESRPGDVARFAANTAPDIAIITGLAPAHLDGYGSVEAAGKDIFALADYVRDARVYVNGESTLLVPFVKPTHTVYGQQGVGKWSTEEVRTDIEGVSFVLRSPQQKLKIQSQLLGTHLVGVLSAAAVIGADLGLNPEQIKAGLARTKPYEHRMQPYPLQGAWVIDDAYNGNIEGIRAGTRLLADLEARRKLYVTPGLIDQGPETEPVHVELGRLVAEARPDVVVLMKNSVTDFIRAGLEQGEFKGEVRIETDPLRFYTHLDQFIAAGDVVMLQNDWTDNYN